MVNAFTKNYGLSYRRVTVSTSGVVSRLKVWQKKTHAALAVSLHAATDALRTSLMPINRRYPLAKLKEGLVEYARTTGDKITIEYILIRNTNCSLARSAWLSFWRV